MVIVTGNEVFSVCFIGIGERLRCDCSSLLQSQQTKENVQVVGTMDCIRRYYTQLVAVRIRHHMTRHDKTHSAIVCRPIPEQTKHH